MKANLKFDNAGLGHDLASDIKNNWWERVYNDAASNVVVDNKKDEVQLNTIEEDGVEVSQIALVIHIHNSLLLSYCTNILFKNI